ncbi:MULTISPECIES: MarP family serine protease [unclassified Nonomuraea]|uniref:MarP family serine protease n=1 Tax=unclassified Nonomuraea TaxID=2593643 RepID=UPI0033CCFBC6
MSGDLLDVVLVVLVVGFGVAGFRQGFVVGVTSSIGFVAGCVLGISVAPAVTNALVTGDVPQTALAVVIVFLIALVGQFAASTLGVRLRTYLRGEPARILDSLGGGLVNATFVLLVAWLVGSLLVSGPWTLVVEQIRGSALLSTLDEAAPEAARDWQRPFKQFIDRSDFPPVLDAIAGLSPVRVPPPDVAVLRSPALRQARTGILQVQGTASSCGKRITGTGFTYAPDHIMTNAHVVAGVDTDLQVVDHQQRPHPAQVVWYNPRRDVAVLYVPGLGLPPLSFDTRAREGQDALVAGYPNGGGFTPEPARVAVRQRAGSPDIYRASQVTRDVYLVRGKIQQGNSGGPLLAVDGRVLGVIFAAVAGQVETGYALTAGEVAPDARQAATATNPVSTQSCD